MSLILKTALFSTILICLAVTGCRTSVPSDDIAEIKAAKSSTLIAWLNEKQLPEDESLTNLSDTFFPAICNELVARHQVNFLLSELNASNTPYASEWLVSEVLCQIDDRRIYNTFALRLGDKEDRESYYTALYLAQRGNVPALATLNRHYFQYPVASFEWAEAVDAFGKYRFMPAASNIVGSLDAASFNLVGSASIALQKMFPDSPKKFIGPSEAEEYYTKRLNGSGF